MRPLTIAAAPRFVPVHLAREPESPWAAMAFGEDVPPATLEEARSGRTALARLLGRERAAAADFLLALADFDRRRGWERLGHASLFAFLTKELGLSSGAAQLRLSAARLLPRHLAVEEALRSGRLCISAVGQLARVLTVENEAEVLPRFLGCSAREAAEVAAAILPRVDPPRREVVRVLRGSGSEPAGAPLACDLPLATMAIPAKAPAPPAEVAAVGAVATPPGPAPLHTYEVEAPARVEPRTPAVEPLTAGLRRLHLTVSKGFVDKVARARTGLSHAIPGATTEQVLEAALDLLLRKQAQRKGLGERAVKKAASGQSPLSPRPLPASRGEGAIHVLPMPTPTDPTSRPTRTPTPTAYPTEGECVQPPLPSGERAGERGEAPSERPLRRPNVPADVERAVRLRDGERCQYPLADGGVCGSTWQVELDHQALLAFGGEATVANLRCLCRPHNARAAREALGEAAFRILARPPRRR